MAPSPLASSVIVFVLAFAGGVWGSVRRIDEERLHLALAFVAGFFLGSAFLDLLPAAFAAQSGMEPGTIGGLALLGFLVIYVIERGLAPGGDIQSHPNAHAVVALTALLGLCGHSVVEGGALLVASAGGAAGESIALSIALHKVIAGLALGSLFRLAHFTTQKTFLLLIVFSLMTPFGTMLSGVVFSGEDLTATSSIFVAITALSSGVFLYVATIDILPEALHSRASLSLKLLLVALGAFVMWLITAFGGG